MSRRVGSATPLKIWSIPSTTTWLDVSGSRLIVQSDEPGWRRPALPQEAALDRERHEQVAVAVLVEEHGDLFAVVALHGSLAPAVAGHAGADRERHARGRRDRCAAAVVVARAARAW